MNTRPDANTAKKGSPTTTQRDIRKTLTHNSIDAVQKRRNPLTGVRHTLNQINSKAMPGSLSLMKPK
jgi:hypothetical protein